MFSNVNPVTPEFCAQVPKPYTFEGYDVPLEGRPFWSGFLDSTNAAEVCPAK